MANGVSRVGPIWTPGAWLAGCLTLLHIKHKALRLFVSGKKIFILFLYCYSMGANDPRV